MAYPIRRAPAKFDRWGKLKGRPQALVLHMTEGNGGIGDLNYLARSPARGVTVHFYAQDDGTIWRMLGLDRISASLNPGDIAGVTDKGYYGRSKLRAVLGAHFQDPNSYVISMEIGGKAAKGPTAAQQKAIIAWGLDMRRQFPSIRGALGHADCTNTKGCPGTTAGMKAIFAGIGGHGLFSAAQAPAPQEDDVIEFDLLPPIVGVFTYDAVPGHRLIGLDGKTLPNAIPAGYVRNINAVARLAKPYGTGPGDRQTVYLTDYAGTPALCLAADGAFAPRVIPTTPAPIDDCTDEAAAAVKPLADRLAAIRELAE